MRICISIKYEKKFYQDFYGRQYRQNIYKDIKPSSGFVKRQKIRAKNLYNFLNSNFKLKKEWINFRCWMFSWRIFETIYAKWLDLFRQ